LVTAVMPDIALGITSANGPEKSAEADITYSAAFAGRDKAAPAVATIAAVTQRFNNLILSSLFSFCV
jgi:hypothetical protein